MSDAYRQQLHGLMPRGAAWSRRAGSILDLLLEGLAVEFGRVQSRFDALPEEADPRTTLELMPDWERTAGLPDTGVDPAQQSLQQRREALVSKWTSTGGQSRGYFGSVAGAMGYDVAIEEFQPFQADISVAEDPAFDDAWRHAWQVRAPEGMVNDFAVDVSAVDEPLRSWGDVGLEARINELKPAHTVVLFAYGEE